MAQVRASRALRVRRARANRGSRVWPRSRPATTQRSTLNTLMLAVVGRQIVQSMAPSLTGATVLPLERAAAPSRLSLAPFRFDRGLGANFPRGRTRPIYLFSGFRE